MDCYAYVPHINCVHKPRKKECESLNMTSLVRLPLGVGSYNLLMELVQPQFCGLS